MEDEIVTQDTNLEGDQDTTPEIESTDTPTIEDFTKSQEYAKNQKIRAEKAERENKELKAKLSKPETETPKNDEIKSNEPDYAKLAFLKGEGVTNPDDQKLVQDEANRLKLPLTDVLGMEHIKSKLKSAQSQREAEAGMPSGSGKGSGGSAKNSVDYWVDKKNADGTYATPEDQELAGKVIEARMKKEGNANKFSELMFT